MVPRSKYVTTLVLVLDPTVVDRRDSRIAQGVARSSSSSHHPVARRTPTWWARFRSLSRTGVLSPRRARTVPSRVVHGHLSPVAAAGVTRSVLKAVPRRRSTCPWMMVGVTATRRTQEGDALRRAARALVRMSDQVCARPRSSILRSALALGEQMFDECCNGSLLCVGQAGVRKLDVECPAIPPRCLLGHDVAGSFHQPLIRDAKDFGDPLEHVR